MGCAKHGLALMCPFLVMATAPKERAAPRNARPARVCIMKAAREGFVCAMASVHASQLQAALLMCALLMTPLPAAVPTVTSHALRVLRPRKNGWAERTEGVLRARGKPAAPGLGKKRFDLSQSGAPPLWEQNRIPPHLLAPFVWTLASANGTAISLLDRRRDTPSFT